MSVSVKEADMEVRLKALQCHFTWGIDRADIINLNTISEKLLERIEFCHVRYHPIYLNILAYLSHLKGDSGLVLGFLDKAARVLGERRDDTELTELLVTYGNYAWVHYHDENMEDVEVYLKKLEEIYQAHAEASENPCDLPNIHGDKGWTFLRLGGDFSQRARDSFEEALEKAPESVSFNVGYATALHYLGRKTPGEATGQLRKALELEPDNAEVMVLLALELQSQRTGTQEPTELVQQALILAPDVPQVSIYAAKFFSIEGSVEQSLEVMRKALELHPASSFLHQQVGRVHRSELIKMQELGKRGGGPGGLGGRRPVGTQMAELKAMAEECIIHFSRAVDLMPSNVHSHLNLAEAYGESGQMEEATEIYRSLQKDQSLTESGRQLVLYKHGTFLFYKRQNMYGAVAQLKAAYQIPVHGSYWERAEKKLRMIAEKWQKPQDAQDILTFLSDQDKLERDRLMMESRRAVEPMPSNIHARLNLAEAYRESGQMEEVTGQLRKALELEPDNAEVMVLLALELQSQRTGTQEPMELVQQALILAPDVPEVSRHVAKFLKLEGSIEQSLGMLHKALELAPTSSFLHHQVGLCHRTQLIKLQKLGRGGAGSLGGQRPLGTPMAKLKAKALKAKAEECIIPFSRAVELMHSDIHARLYLAHAYQESGRTEEASEIYRSLEKDQSLSESDRQKVLYKHGIFLFYKRKNVDGAVAQLKAAYQIPVRGFDQERAAKKLRMIAKKCQKPQDAQDILTFLSDQDKLERERSVMERKSQEKERMNSEKVGDFDDLTGAFDKGLKLK